MNAPIIGTIEIPRLTELSDAAKRRGRAALDASRTAYLAGLGVAATAQQETAKAVDAIVERANATVDTLVERGTPLHEKRATKVASMRDNVRDEIATRRDAALDRLDRGVFEPVSRASANVVRAAGLPTRDEVRKLASSVAALSRKVDKLIAKLGETHASAEPTSDAPEA